MVRRVDRPTNALPDRPTDLPMDMASYRGALAHLKIVMAVPRIHGWWDSIVFILKDE